MKITQTINTGVAMLFSIGVLFSQSVPVVFDAHNGIEDETDGGVNVGFYTAGMNRVNLRSTFSFQRATVAIVLPVDYAFSGYGDMLAVPPSFRRDTDYLIMGMIYCRSLVDFPPRLWVHMI